MLCNVVGQVFVSWCAVVAKVFLVVAASEPPEAHVHRFEHLVHRGLFSDASGGGFFALNGRGGLRPAHFHENVS